MNVILRTLENDDLAQFILDNQEAFRYGALEEFDGMFKFRKEIK